MKSWRGRNTAREIRNHVNWQTPFSCLWTFAETGANSATSSNLKWTARSQRCPTGASLASSRWPHVLSTFISLHLLLNLREYVAGGVLLLAAAPVADGALPCHWSWRPGQHPLALSLRYLFLHIIFPWHTKCLHINYLQEPDPWYRPARHGLYHPQLPHGAVLHHLLNLQKLKMLQVLYIGGSKVSQPDACVDVFGPRCSIKSTLDLWYKLTSDFLSFAFNAKLSVGAVSTLLAARSKPSKPMSTWFSEDFQVL